MAVERETRRLDGLGQLGFDFRLAQPPGDEAKGRAEEGDLFLDAEPRELSCLSARNGWMIICARPVWAGCSNSLHCWPNSTYQH